MLAGFELNRNRIIPYIFYWVWFPRLTLCFEDQSKLLSASVAWYFCTFVLYSVFWCIHCSVEGHVDVLQFLVTLNDISKNVPAHGLWCTPMPRNGVFGVSVYTEKAEISGDGESRATCLRSGWVNRHRESSCHVHGAQRLSWGSSTYPVCPMTLCCGPGSQKHHCMDYTCRNDTSPPC